MAAVLSGGPDAVLSHRSAAELWGLVSCRQGPVDVTAPCRRGRSPRGIAAHRDDRLASCDRAAVCGIPSTSVPRTLLDVAGSCPPWELRTAVEEAEVKRVLDLAAVRDLIKRSRGRRGVARLRMAIDSLHPDTRKTRSPLERRFLRVCQSMRLPRPEVNALMDLGPTVVEADFLWREARLILETDGRESHDTASAFENDRRRDQQLMVAGWRVVRCTWRQLSDEPAAVVKTIEALLR
jgi:very-short-patch-repair endonuclease